MPIKKLAQLILAIEGFLLLTAIVVSTSYQLSRKTSVTEIRSKAQTAADAELPWGYLIHLGNEGTKVKFRVEAYDNTALKGFVVFQKKVGGSGHSQIINPSSAGTSFTGNFEWETTTIGDSGQYMVWLQASDTADNWCSGSGLYGDDARCNRKDRNKTDGFFVVLPLGQGTPPSCNTFNLSPVTAGMADPVTASIVVSSGSSAFATDKIALHAVLSPNPQGGWGRLSACSSSGCSFPAFTPREKNLQAGAYTVWLSLENTEGLSCTDKPASLRQAGDPPACGCGVKTLTVTAPASTISCTELTIDPTTAGPTTVVTSTLTVSSSTSFANESVLLAAGKHEELIGGVMHELGAFRCLDVACQTMNFSFTPAGASISSPGVYRVFLVVKNQAHQIICSDNPADSTNPDCGCYPPTLTITPAGNPSCTLAANPASLQTGQTTQIAATAAGGTSPYQYTWAVTPVGAPPVSGSGASVSWTAPTAAARTNYLVALTVRDAASRSGNCAVNVAVDPPAPPSQSVVLKLRDDGNRVFPTSGFLCGTSSVSNTQPLEFNLVATHAVDPADSLINGVDRVELRYRMQGTSTWQGVAFHQCPKVWDNTKKTLVGPAECKLYNMDWWRWLPRAFYQGDNLYEFKASAYSPGIGLYAETVVSGVRCTGPAAQPLPPAVVKDPECVSFELSASQVAVNTPVQVKVRARCAGGSCTDLAKEGLRDFNFYQKKGEAQWLWAGSKSCYLSWPLHKVCFTGEAKAKCGPSDAACNAGTFNWVPTSAGTYQLHAKVSNNAGRQAICGPATVTVGAAGGATLPQSWWQKLVAVVRGWVKSLVPPALAQEATAPLKAIFKLDDAPHSLLGRVVTVSLLELEESYNLVAVPRGEGIYEATINLPASAAGPARIGVKPAGYLQRVKEATLVAGQTTTLDFGETKFLGGDLNHDNKLTIADLAQELLPQFAEVNELSVPLDDDNRFMDLNDDGIINVLDISIVLKNLTELEVRGEE